MYKLTLTHSERKAIDWVGNRYLNGDDLYRLLWESECTTHVDGMDDDELEWSGSYSITFLIPESIAWGIQANAQLEDGYWPCFSDELAEKMQRFVDSIV